MTRGIYVASRASVPARAAMWRAYRDAGWPVISSWIDADGEAGVGDLGALWVGVAAEVADAAGLVFYAEPGDFPLKGALVEVGIALGCGVPVVVVAPGVDVDPVTCRPVGSWVCHPAVVRAATPVEAFCLVLGHGPVGPGVGPPDPAGGVWVSRPVAARVVGCHMQTVARMVQRGELVGRRLPGCHPQISLVSAMALRDRAVAAGVVEAGL